MTIIRWRIILGLFLVAILGATLPVQAAQQTQSGSVNLSGVVPGPPPSTPPTIDSPQQGATFSQKNIEISGTCISGLTVKLYSNNIFIGSAFCNSNAYALHADLVEGRNDLIARQYDSLDQSSPDSDTVTVFFVPPSQTPPLPGETPNPTGNGAPSSSEPPQTAQFQLVIDYNYSFQGIGVNTPIHLPIHFLGGTPPYAVSVNWGDGNASVVSRETAEQFFVDHIYTKPGVYIVKIRISDKNGSEAYLQFVLIVNGQVSATPKSTLFGTPLSEPIAEVGPYIVIPAIAFGGLGVALGYAFAHRWKGPIARFRRKRGRE